MPTILGHGVVGLALAGKARFVRVLKRGHLLVACVVCAMLPDIDYIGYKLGVQYHSLFGHRGFTHSFFFAALIALLVSWILNRQVKGDRANLSKLFLLLFVVTVTHPLLDAMTDGGEGVAFFSPFSNHRYFFSYRPIMVSPLGIEAFFGRHGLLVLLNELLVVVIPLGLLVYFNEFWKKRRGLAVGTLVAWVASLFVLNGLFPLNNIAMTINDTGRPVIDLYVKQYKDPEALKVIPVFGISDRKLHTDFWEMEKQGLFDRRLETQNMKNHWSSGFFPNWYGGIAGRWQDWNYILFLRTLLGYGVAGSREIVDVLKESKSDPDKQEFLFKLSPTEKYDLATGDYTFSATKSILSITHDAVQWPKFWYGICNGMASAAKWYEEPFRTVDVINPNGFLIRFHPNDVKALLGYAQANAALWTEFGARCNANGPEADSCRVNPGALLIATLNRIGLAHDSFILDAFSGTRKQFYLFDAAKIDVLLSPQPVEQFKGWIVPTPVKFVAKVRFNMDFSSTILSDKVGGDPDESAQGDGYYKKVGRIVVPRVLDAAIALNDTGEVIGGAWLGDEDVPDLMFFPGPNPSVDEQNRLKINPNLNWTVIKKIYEQSISNERARTPIDLSI